jgi:hypothetical protein
MWDLDWSFYLEKFLIVFISTWFGVAILGSLATIFWKGNWKMRLVTLYFVGLISYVWWFETHYY